MGVRVGFVGTGEIARVHAQAIEQLSGEMEVVASYDVIEDSAKNFSKAYGGRVYEDAASLIKDKEVDSVYICTRHDSHVELASIACDAGKSIFLEKPLAMNREEGKYLYEKYKKTPVPMAVGFNMRVSPAVLRFKELMKEHKVQPEIFRASMTAAPFMNSWASDPIMGGGVLVCLGSHMFDLITHLLGSPVEKVCVSVQHLAQSHTLEGNAATILVELKNGVCGTLLLHDRGNKEFHVEPGGRMTNITVYSPQGTFEVDTYGNIRYGTSKGFCEEIVSGPRDQCHSWGYVQEAKEFLMLLKGEKTDLCSIKEALEVVSVVDAAKKSDYTKSWVKIR